MAIRFYWIGLYQFAKIRPPNNLTALARGRHDVRYYREAPGRPAPPAGL